MYGLDSRNVNFNIIYVSEMSKRILLNFPDPVDRRDASTFLAADQNKPRHETTALGYEGRYKHLEPYLRTLEMGVPTKVEGVHDDIYVTALNANHCPGSCMFVFDSADKRVLYTGDFRLEASALEVIIQETPALTDSDKRIDCMYIDTSHCSSGRPTWYIPHRTVVVRHALEMIAQIPASDGVFIKCKQMVGFERMFKAMAERFNTKVHVNECWLKIFAEDPTLAHVFTNDPSKARIHAHHDILEDKSPDYYNAHGLKLPCCKQFTNTPRRHLFLSVNGCRYPGSHSWDPDIQKLDYEPPLDMTRTSAMGWHLVPYQQHSSFSEIAAFVQRVNPRVIYPCVVDPDQRTTIHDVWACLRRIRDTAEEDYFKYANASTSQLLPANVCRTAEKEYFRYAKASTTQLLPANVCRTAEKEYFSYANASTTQPVPANVCRSTEKEHFSYTAATVSQPLPGPIPDMVQEAYSRYATGTASQPLPGIIHTVDRVGGLIGSAQRNDALFYTVSDSSNRGTPGNLRGTVESAQKASGVSSIKCTAGFVSRRKAAVGRRLLRTTSCGGEIKQSRQVLSMKGYKGISTSCGTEIRQSKQVRGIEGYKGTSTRCETEIRQSKQVLSIEGYKGTSALKSSASSVSSAVYLKSERTSRECRKAENADNGSEKVYQIPRSKSTQSSQCINADDGLELVYQLPRSQPTQSRQCLRDVCGGVGGLCGHNCTAEVREGTVCIDLT